MNAKKNAAESASNNRQQEPAVDESAMQKSEEAEESTLRGSAFEESALQKREEAIEQRLALIEQREAELEEREEALKAAEAEKKQVLLRIPRSLWRDLAQWAEEDLRSINGQIEYLLTRAVKVRKEK